MEPVLIIGCGDLGRRTARRLMDDGRPVLAVVRSAQSAVELAARGIPVQRVDLDDAAGAQTLPLDGRAVIYLAPPPESGIDDPRMGHFLDAAGTQPPGRIVYVSTTGVYGDRQGAEVTEDTPVQPGTDRARRRLDAETRLRRFMDGNGTAVVILRVPGIYGPGRLPLDRIRRGVPVIRPEESPPGNRIHVDDLASLCLAALDRGRPGEVFNAGDGEHASMTDFVFTVADLAGLPRPPCVPLADADRYLSPAMMSFIRESRIVRAGRALKALDVTLCHPTIESGIRASLAEDGRS